MAAQLISNSSRVREACTKLQKVWKVSSFILTFTRPNLVMKHRSRSARKTPRVTSALILQFSILNSSR